MLDDACILYQVSQLINFFMSPHHNMKKKHEDNERSNKFQFNINNAEIKMHVSWKLVDRQSCSILIFPPVRMTGQSVALLFRDLTDSIFL